MNISISELDAALLYAGSVRHSALQVIHEAGRRDAKLLQASLIGKRCQKRDTWYEIVSVSYGYDGYMTARGYRIIQSGKRGSRVWDIGPITSGNFD